MTLPWEYDFLPTENEKGGKQDGLSYPLSVGRYGIIGMAGISVHCD